MMRVLWLCSGLQRKATTISPCCAGRSRPRAPFAAEEVDIYFFRPSCLLPNTFRSFSHNAEMGAWPIAVAATARVPKNDGSYRKLGGYTDSISCDEFPCTCSPEKKQVYRNYTGLPRYRQRHHWRYSRYSKFVYSSPRTRVSNYLDNIGLS